MIQSCFSSHTRQQKQLYLSYHIQNGLRPVFQIFMHSVYKNTTGYFTQINLQLFLSQIRQVMIEFTNQDIVNLLFGGSVTLISIFLDLSLKKEADHYMKMKKSIQKCKLSSAKEISYSQLRDEKNKNLKRCVVMEKVIPTFKQQPIYIIERQIPIHIGRKYSFNHVTGGKFLVAHQGQRVSVEINDTLVMGSILKEKSQLVRIFGHMEPVVKKNQYFLRKNIHLTLVGALSFELASNKFKIEPIAMGHSISQIIQHYNEEYILSTLPRIFTFLMIGFGVWFMLTPIQKLLKKLIQKLPWKSKDPVRQRLMDEQYFRQRVEYKTNKQNVFECIQCHNNTTNIVYKCGHLCICESCHDRNAQNNPDQYICPSCNQISTSYIKLFFS